ncbi:hypothetical protein Plav_1109 [Parvibaculum lavamentivorans DS-1]|uniref:Uncharacterized protein n=1 Tax=Parvibaculum lavamentivorans (strain DS-1 / DSM 13023 / NCIMB 13966) TaxID=402881 RepID=A7HS47_PARL1|nr:hypothetical protein [Parvibaculum lavamentivorans]ABS62730.1 hypothetical protein Plav_1109 [Parvibaculum lavamentivorans DS-1]
MRILGAIAAILVLSVLAFVTWYKLTFPSYTFHYRLTVQVEVDGAIKEASGVIGVCWEDTPDLPDVPTFQLRPFGQALLVDLGGHGVLFVPLGANTNYEGLDLSQLPFGRELPRSRDVIERALKLKGRSQVGLYNLPQFIWQPQLNDPSSAVVVTAEQFPEVISPNVRLVGVWTEITDEPVSTGLENEVSWIGEMYEQRRKLVTGNSQDRRFRWSIYALRRDAP